jgi:hypothetical protein
VVLPTISLLPTIRAVLGSLFSSCRFWFWLSRSLTRMAACLLGAYVIRAMPLRWVAVSSDRIWPPLLFAA